MKKIILCLLCLILLFTSFVNAFAEEEQIVTKEYFEDSYYYMDTYLKEESIDDYTIIKDNGYYYIQSINGLTSKKLFNSESMNAVKLFIYEDTIYIIGNTYTYGSAQDLTIWKMDKDTLEFTYQKYTANSVDIVNDATIIDDKIYIVGTTSSFNGIFSGTKQNKDSFLLTYNLQTEDINYLNYGIEGNDEITKIFNIDNTIFLLRSDNTIINPNTDFEINLSYPLSHIVKEEDNYYLLTLLDNQVCIYMFNLNYGFKEHLKITLPTDYNLNHIIKTAYGYLGFTNNDIYLLNDNLTLLDINIDKINLSFIDNDIYTIINNKPYYVLFNQVYFDGMYIYHNQEILTDIIVPVEEIFGIYTKELDYQFGNIHLKETLTKEVELVSSISDNNIYSIGITISGNGDIYVDDLKVNDYYEITTPGRHDIKFIGHNQEINYTIETRDFHEEYDHINFLTTKEGSLENITYNTTNLNITEGTLSNELVNSDYNNKLWILLIPFLSVISLALVIVRTVKR